MGNQLWDEFINNLPPEFAEDLPEISDHEYCVCGCGVDRMIKDCLNGSRY